VVAADGVTVGLDAGGLTGARGAPCALSSASK